MSSSLFFSSHSAQDKCSNLRVLQDTSTPIQDYDEKLSISNMFSNKFKHFYDTSQIPNLTSPLDNNENPLTSETNNLNTFWSTNYLSLQRIDYKNENEETKEISFLKEE